MPDSIVENFEEELEENILKNGSLDTKKLIQTARGIMWKHAGIARNEKQLKMGIKEIEKLRAEVSKKGLKNEKTKYDTIVQKMRLRTILDLGELVIRGAIERKESRGAHYREDYKKKSNKYLKNFFFQKKNGKLTMFVKPVPKPSAVMAKGLKDFEKTHNYTHLE